MSKRAKWNRENDRFRTAPVFVQYYMGSPKNAAEGNESALVLVHPLPPLLIWVEVATQGKLIQAARALPLALFLLPWAATAQTSSPQTSSPQTIPPPLQTVGDHWNLFLGETFSPLSAGATVFNSLFSQATNSDPRYGKDGIAFAQRIGASAADIAAQNLFGDFAIASALHEDPRYIRKGEGYTKWQRFTYAVSRAVLIRTSSGRRSFNWDNFLGSAMSTGFSNLYYPPPSRTGGAMLIHFATDVADNGFVNLAPEFWPDFKRKFFGHHRR